MRSLIRFGDTSEVSDPEAAFDAAVASSHEIVTRVDIVFDREVIVEDLALVEGSIINDRRARVLNRLFCDIAEPTRVAMPVGDVLSPYGYEARVYRGIRTRQGGALMVALGTFPIQRSALDSVGRLSRITAEDRSRLVSDAAFEDTYTVPAGEPYETQIEFLIADGVPGLVYDFPSTGFVTPALTFTDRDDRWEVAQNMAQSIGFELYFDGLGQCTMRPEPTFSSAPSTRLREGDNLISAVIDQDRTPAYNRVVAYSSNASLDTVYRGVATDDDPTSPTYYFGPFGRKPRFYRSALIASQDQADSAAATVLAGQLGVARSVGFSAVPDPRLEASDVVTVERAALGLDTTTNIVDLMTIGLTPEQPMSGNVRANQG